MLKFKVSTGVVKKTNQLMINSNKLNHVFYNVGKTFVINKSDVSVVRDILKKNFIKLTLV